VSLRFVDVYFYIVIISLLGLFYYTR